MRTIVEIKTDHAKDLIEQLSESDHLEIVTTYDPIEKLTGRVEKMHQAFKEFKNNRGSMQIMNYYLRGRGLTQAEIDRVTAGVEEFLKLVENDN